MAKLKDEKINVQDVNEYLEKYSDFSFEIKVLKKLVSLGFQCEHSGTYEDPITKKTREFDIRAWKLDQLNEKTTFRFCLAVECKNLRENFPLVVHCLPRSEQESYQHLVWSKYPENFLNLFSRYGRRLRFDEQNTFYCTGALVGKSCDQVGRKAGQNNEITGSDSDVFDKISQAINSTYDLFRESHYACDEQNTVVSFILPILVVPNDRIWIVTYDHDGNVTDGPKISPSISYYIDKKWKVGGKSEQGIENYYISHLEIVQFNSLEKLIDDHQYNDRFSLKNIYKCLIKKMER